MAYQGKTMFNSKTGIETKFIQTSKDTNGQLLEMVTTYPAHSHKPPPHYHPYQEENFIILSGEMTVRMDGQQRILRQGDTLHIPKNKVHSMWNHTDGETVVNWQVRPALDSEFFFEITTGLANDGKTNAGGRPGILQSAMLMNRFSNVFRLTKPARWKQRVIFGVLGIVGWVMGYRAVYPKYLD